MCEWINLCRAAEMSGEFDVVHSHAYLFGLPLERLFRCPLVNTMHVVGAIQGAAVGGFLLGIAEQFTAYAWADRYAEVVNFVIFLLVLLFRPQGLFGGKA